MNSVIVIACWLASLAAMWHAGRCCGRLDILYKCRAFHDGAHPSDRDFIEWPKAPSKVIEGVVVDSYDRPEFTIDEEAGT